MEMLPLVRFPISTLNSASPFIIPIVSHWNGPAAVDWVLWSHCLQTMLRKVGTKILLCLRHNTPLKDIILEMLPLVRFQSQQCIIIHHTHNESLEWSSCSGFSVMVPLLADYVEKSGERILLCPSHTNTPPNLPLEMVPLVRLQDQQCIVHHHSSYS